MNSDGGKTRPETIGGDRTKVFNWFGILVANDLPGPIATAVTAFCVNSGFSGTLALLAQGHPVPVVFVRMDQDWKLSMPPFENDTMSDQPLKGKRCLAFAGDIYEDLELWYPKLRMIEAGAEFVVAGPLADTVYAGKNGYPCRSDAAIDDVKAARFDALLLPGGFMPDKLRRDPNVLQLIQEFHTAGKCIAAICHGGWMAISAGVYRGVRVTGSPGIKDDLINAGAVWEDAAVVVDGHHISSRKPDDLPDFCRAMIKVISEQD